MLRTPGIALQRHIVALRVKLTIDSVIYSDAVQLTRNTGSPNILTRRVIHQMPNAFRSLGSLDNAGALGLLHAVNIHNLLGTRLGSHGQEQVHIDCSVLTVIIIYIELDASFDGLSRSNNCLRLRITIGVECIDRAIDLLDAIEQYKSKES